MQNASAKKPSAKKPSADVQRVGRIQISVSTREPTPSPVGYVNPQRLLHYAAQPISWGIELR